LATSTPLELSNKSIYYLIFLQFIINPGCVDQRMVDVEDKTSFEDSDFSVDAMAR